MPEVIDADSHIYEPRDMWSRYIDPSARDDALAVTDDALGYAWVTWRGRQVSLAEVQFPSRLSELGDTRQRMLRGEPAEASYDELLPPAYTQPSARAEQVAAFGLDASVVFPNHALVFENTLGEDLPALLANLRACNRWMADVVAEGAGRLHGVGHLSLRDTAWAKDEIGQLAAAGIRLAMTAPAPVNGKPLSDPSLDAVWAAFCDAGVAPVFHVGAYDRTLHPAWYASDPDRVNPVMESVFLWVPPAVALTDMIVGGVLERFPDLRIGVIELAAHWVPQYLMMLDGGFGFYTAQHGAPLRELPLRPSEYFLRQVRVAALAYEDPAKLVGQVGPETFMFGSDWPHAEGIADPLGDYRRHTTSLSGEAEAKLYGGNAAWLLHA